MRALIVLLAYAAGPLAAQPAFQRTDLQVAGQFGPFLGSASAAVAGDFNGDGRPDLVIGGLAGLSVLLNSGGGAFSQSAHYAVTSCGPLVAADFNRDGKLDLFLGESCKFNGLVLLGRGDGTFGPAQDVPGCSVGVAGDLNGDAIPDLVCQDRQQTIVRVFLGNGDGTFRPGATLPGRPIEGPLLPIADFNHDGRADFAALIARSVYVYLGHGDGTFDLPVQTVISSPPLAAIPTQALLADLDGDGAQDLITPSDIFPGKGDGGFGAPRHYFTPPDANSPSPFAAVDLNGDGRLDLIAGGLDVYPVRNRILVFLGKGDGNVLPPVEYTVGWGPYFGTTADLDGDGRSDVITFNLASNTVSLLLTKGAGIPGSVRAVSAASGAAVVAPGALATLYASTGLDAVEGAAGPPWPERLQGLSLQVRDSGGATLTAPLLYVASNQINFQVPEQTATGEATLSIVYRSGTSQAGTMTVAAVAPGIFMANPVGLTAAAIYRRVAGDGLQSSGPLFQCAAAGPCLPVPAEPSAGGSFVTFYGTGFRNASAANVKCLLYGMAVNVEYAGPEGTPGLDRITIRLPEIYDEFWDQVGAADVVVSVDGVLANRLWVFLSRHSESSPDKLP
jgi:uncharacterized protein (TIGR03437 family)